jgi:tripartite-type tricarboxylate transporter receptor subunit TctC
MKAWRLLIVALMALPALAMAQYPERPIRFILPSAAGTVADMLARSYAEKLSAQIGQPVVIENRAGAAGAIAADVTAKAPGDGYTMLLNSSALAINPWFTKQPFDFMKDLTPIARSGQTGYIVTVDARLPIRNLDELIAYAKQNPGKLNCATYGIGSPPHLALEMFRRAAGVDILHVPYKSSNLALPEIFSGQLGCIVEPPPGAVAHIRSGRLRVVAQTGDARMSAFPEADPIGRRFPTATMVGWQGIFVPASTPKPIVDRLRGEWAKLLALPEIEQKIRDAGFQSGGGSVADFVGTMSADYDKFGRIIKEAGIRPE